MGRESCPRPSSPLCFSDDNARRVFATAGRIDLLSHMYTRFTLDLEAKDEGGPIHSDDSSG